MGVLTAPSSATISSPTRSGPLKSLSISGRGLQREDETLGARMERSTSPRNNDRYRADSWQLMALGACKYCTCNKFRNRYALSDIFAGIST